MSEQKVGTTAGNAGRDEHANLRRVVHLRRVLLARITKEEVLAIFNKLIEMAAEGNLQAAKLVLQYTIGKPGGTELLDCEWLDEPPASGGRKSPVGAPQQGAYAPRSPSVPADLMRQIEDAIKMPRPAISPASLTLPKAANGRR